MLYLIGLGLNESGYSWGAYNAIQKSDKTYLENYTVEFPYSISSLEKQFKKKIIPVGREFVEQKLDELLGEAKKKNIVLLVYGNPLSATTHITILQEAAKKKVKTKVIHAASILDAVAETGLQIYKFGKTASMPSFEANSYINIIRENQKIKSHTLILVDIGLPFFDALTKLEKDSNSKKIKLDKIIACSRLGTSESKILYDTSPKLKSKKVKAPFCLIIPSELHFVEKDFLVKFNN